MPTSVEELQSFQRYAAARIGDGGSRLDLDDLLDEWKALSAPPERQADDLKAVKAALQDIENGDSGRPATQVAAELRGNLDQ